MTREEATKRLERWLKDMHEGYQTHLEHGGKIDFEHEVNMETIAMAIEALQERPKGRWKHGNCTECGLYVGETTCRHYSYCPNCGADMRGEEE